MSRPAVESIHLAAASHMPMKPVPRVVAEAGKGLVGDRYHGATLRQVTVQAAGELAEAAAEAGRPIEPGRTRRNITISADCVPRTPGHRWSIGNVELEVTRDAAPCTLMEEIFGTGAQESLQGRAGVGCRVISGGEIAAGDAVDLRMGAEKHGGNGRPGSFVTDRVRLEVDGAVATITNNNPAKHNAFDDEMDVRLFEILEELAGRPEVRAVVWRAEGRSWSSGRDVSAIGTNVGGLTHHELMVRGHRGIQRLWELDAPVIAAIGGWAMGGSFQRALLCDIRIAADDARFRLPEVGHGVIPDTGGVSVLYEMCGHGLVSDMVLTGRTLTAAEALAHGIVSRVVAPHDLDAEARAMAEAIAAAPAVTVKLARRVISQLARPQQRASMADELIYQTFLNRSDDFAEMKAARAEGRPPRYTGS